MSNEIITVKNLSFKYAHGEDVLKNIDFSILKGQWVSIIGHNGSGKSTLAKFLNGLLVPSSPNQVTVNGQDTFYEEQIWEVRKKVGMVFQNPDNQMVATTVRDDVAFGLENNGIKRVEMIERISEALYKVNMEKYIDHEPHRLSGGQKQRVAIAGIIAMRPSVIILDEATSMLDPLGRKEVLDTLDELCNNEGITILNITHDLEETLRSDMVITMNKGEITIQGTTKYVFSQKQQLIDAGLDLPFSLQLQNKLMEKGYDLSNFCLTKEELVNELWKLKLKT